MLMKRIAPLSWLLVIALLSPASAQTLYKSTMPDGRVDYGDKPAPGAARVEEIKPDTSKAGVVPPTPRETSVLQQMEADRKGREGGQDRVQAAEQTLKQAEAALAAGKEPLPGERIGTAGGASRLTEAYFERQKALEEAVARARRNLEQARSGR